MLSCNQKKNLVLGQEIKASNEFENYKASTLVDSDTTNDNWNSGKSGEEYITINFDSPKSIDTITFYLSSIPESQNMINILTSKNGSDFESYVSEERLIGNSDRVNYSKKIEDVKSIRIVISNPNSWISIRNLKVIGT